MVMSREEVFRATGPTSGAVVEVKMGAKKDGRITAAKAVLKYQSGAFPGSPVQQGCICGLAVYDLPNAEAIGYDVLSNRPKVAAYRAPGAPIGSFGVESCIDELARELGIDPLRMREINGAKDGTKEPQKIDEFAEAQHALNGPAGNPECVWLGRRVVSLLWRDDLDTAFRHLDLYDRFGCPSGHIQVTFRCLVLHANTIDPKAADSLNGRVHACWINPALQPPAPAAAAQNPTTTR